MKKRRIKFPIELPKRIYHIYQWYNLKSIWLLNDLKEYCYPHQWYVQIHYKNDKWGYDLYITRFGAAYLLEDLIGMKYEDFRKAEKQLIESLGLKTIVY